MSQANGWLKLLFERNRLFKKAGKAPELWGKLEKLLLYREGVGGGGGGGSWGCWGPQYVRSLAGALQAGSCPPILCLLYMHSMQDGGYMSGDENSEDGGEVV